MGKTDRVSRTLVRPLAGFHAELPGLDLATLIQMACTRRERLVLRVRARGEEGFLYTAEGRIVHATLGELGGEAAVARMLTWTSGEFSVADHPFPVRATIHCSTEAMLLEAARLCDETADAEQTSSSQIEKRRHDPPALPAPAGPPSVARPAPAAESGGGSLIASARVDREGELVGSAGNPDLLLPLIAYTRQLTSLLGDELALDPFEAMHAELAGLRVVIFEDGPETVGLLLRPGAAAQALRQRLGV